MNEKNIIKKIIEQRGLNERDLFGSFSDLEDYKLLPDYEEAIAKISKAIMDGKSIVLYGDYDVDGTLGMSVAYLMLQEVTPNVFTYSNNRFTQGYGISKSGVDEILSKYRNIGLIITIDNGIVAFEAIEYVKSLGIDIIVTDHHEPLEILPEATVVNPKRNDSKYPFSELCGCGVIWQLLRRFSSKDYSYLDLVAIATVGDVVPLLGENRIIVKEGLKLLNYPNRISTKLLKDMLKVETVDAHNTLAFKYVPTINSLGRMSGDMSLAVKFFTSNNEKEAAEILEKMIELNEERKEKTKTQYETALKNLDAEKNIIISFDPSFDEGIVGLISGKITEKFNKPSLVFSKTETGLKASGRSTNDFNIIEMLRTLNQDLFLSLGGHSMACGLLIDEKNFDEFKKEIDKLNPTIKPKEISYDFEIPEEMITLKLIEEINKLGPFGEGFPYPKAMIPKFKVQKIYTMGSDKRHLKLEGNNVSLVGFDMAKEYKELGYPQEINAIGVLNLNEYNGKTSIQMFVDKIETPR